MEHKKYACIYAAAILFALLYIIYTINLSDPKKNEVIEKNYEDYGKEWIKDDDAKIDIPENINKIKDDSVIIKKKLDIEYTNDLTLAIHTHNQCLKVYIDGDVIYDMEKGQEAFLISSYSDAWNYIEIKEEYIGKEISLEYVSHIKKSQISISDIIIGEKTSIKIHMVKENLWLVFIAIILFASSTFIMIFWRTMKGLKNGNKILYLSNISMLFAIWLVSKTQFFQLVKFENKFEIVEILAFESMIIMPLAMYLYIMSLVEQIHEEKVEVIDGYQEVKKSKKHSVIYSIKCMYLIQVIVIIISNFLLILVKNNHHTSYLVQNIKYISIFVSCIYILVIIILSLKYEDSIMIGDKRIKLGMIFFIIALILDTIKSIETIEKYNNIFAVISISAMLLILDVNSINNFFSSISKSTTVKMWKDLASIDILTKVNSRIAYVEYIDSLTDDEVIDKGVLSIDINNLKIINDTYGHATGDRYIIECIEKIKLLCGTDAKCFRIGGDEFVIIFNNMKEKVLENIAERFDEFLAKKVLFDGHVVSFAYGFEIYDKEKDRDLYDTIKRADKKMYKHKEKIKRIQK